MKQVLLFICFVVTSCGLSAEGNGRFFRQYWAEFDSLVSNHYDGRWRVNDPGLSLHENFGKRVEARANGLMLIRAEEDLFQVESTELYLELWGGHPGTVKKQVFVNGRGPYAIPGYGAELHHCTYSYPDIPIELPHLVSGINALQFFCERGSTFWGHYIMDQAALRFFLADSHAVLKNRGLAQAAAHVLLTGDGRQNSKSRILAKKSRLYLDCPSDWTEQIQSVTYLGYYLGFDDRGNQLELDWHGYTHGRDWRNVLGNSETPPFEVIWDTGMIPDAGRPLAVKAIVQFHKGNLYYETPVLNDLFFPKKRQSVKLYSCSEMPVPFWSRDKQLKEGNLILPDPLPKIDQIELWIKVWDGGEGEVEHPFKLNGHPYSVVSGRAVHDVLWTRVQVNPKHVTAGKNGFSLYSDTHHHGIEILLPGPCLIVRSK